MLSIQITGMSVVKESSLCNFASDVAADNSSLGIEVACTGAYLVQAKTRLHRVTLTDLAPLNEKQCIGLDGHITKVMNLYTGDFPHCCRLNAPVILETF